MAFKTLTFAFAALFAIASCASHRPSEESKEEFLFKNFILANCLATAFEGSTTAADAHRAANGYMELGNMPFEAYEKSSSLVETWLRKSYESKSGGQIETMKCIDLYRSPELKALYIKHTRQE